ncbi:MAG: divalent-cation tolerance protein CutA [Candidatus Marinamargulisbacteria bacterium]
MTSKLLIIETTYPHDFDLTDIAKDLVQDQLAICIQETPQIKSTYLWNNKVETDFEKKVTLKITDQNKETVRKLLEETHPYDVPQIITICPNHVNEAYSEWAMSS